MAATYAGFASPDCAAPSGFLNLLTPYSTINRPTLLHVGNVFELLLSEAFPSQ